MHILPSSCSIILLYSIYVHFVVPFVRVHTKQILTINQASVCFLGSTNYIRWANKLSNACEFLCNGTYIKLLWPFAAPVRIAQLESFTFGGNVCGELLSLSVCVALRRNVEQIPKLFVPSGNWKLVMLWVRAREQIEFNCYLRPQSKVQPSPALNWLWLWLCWHKGSQWNNAQCKLINKTID